MARTFSLVCLADVHLHRAARLSDRSALTSRLDDFPTSLLLIDFSTYLHTSQTFHSWSG